jgi:ribosomal-protein-alanine N-acetyltransferase
MSAVVRPPEPSLRPMGLGVLDQVAAIEAQAYAFPWTRGNFVDSLAAGYLAEVLCEGGVAIGYYVAMAGVQEMHLLNITVAPAQQGRGHGRLLLDRVVARAREAGAQALWLEVRESNALARGLYARYGFASVGVRRGYYPAPRRTREDAVVMSLALGTTPQDER